MGGVSSSDRNERDFERITLLVFEPTAEQTAGDGHIGRRRRRGVLFEGAEERRWGSW